MWGILFRYEMSHWEILFGAGLMNFRMLSLTKLRLVELRATGSSLFRSIMIDRKEVFLKKLFLILIKGISLIFLVFQIVLLERATLNSLEIWMKWIARLVLLSVFLNVRNLLLYLKAFLIFHFVLVCKSSLIAKLFRTLWRYHGARFLLRSRHQKIYMSCVINGSCLIQESLV